MVQLYFAKEYLHRVRQSDIKRIRNDRNDTNENEGRSLVHEGRCKDLPSHQVSPQYGGSA